MRQLALLRLMHERVAAGNTQLIFATHAPILMSFPGAEIIHFDGTGLHRLDWKETEHYKLTRTFLESPEVFWKHLKE